MKNALTVWKWSLGFVARSYRTVMLLALLGAVWGIGAYELLGVPAESSLFLMALALAWAILQILLACVVLGGTVAGASAAATGPAAQYPARSIWTLGRKKMMTTLLFGVVSLVVFWAVSRAFSWANDHSLEVASYLTLHLQKPVNREFLETRIFAVIEWLLWVMVWGFLLGSMIVILRSGWSAARKQSRRLLAGSAYRTPFLTSVLSTFVFGGLACRLAYWHPRVPPGFWDYTQVAARFSVVLLLLAAGAMFWSLSLARLILAPLPSAE